MILFCLGGDIMDKNLPVGVIDSGVGGLSVLKVLQQALPNEDFYISAIRRARLTGSARKKKFALWCMT